MNFKEGDKVKFIKNFDPSLLQKIQIPKEFGDEIIGLTGVIIGRGTSYHYTRFGTNHSVRIGRHRFIIPDQWLDFAERKAHPLTKIFQ